MLAIRLQRTGRSGHAQFRVIVQDSRFSPARGRVVSYLGSYDPHTKKASLDSEKIAGYLANGAQPSDTAASLFLREGIKLPAWVKTSEPKSRSVRNPEKRRATAPAPAPNEPAPKDEPTAAAGTEPADAVAQDNAAQPVPDEPAEETPPAENSGQNPSA